MDMVCIGKPDAFVLKQSAFSGYFRSFGLSGKSAQTSVRPHHAVAGHPGCERIDPQRLTGGTGAASIHSLGQGAVGGDTSLRDGRHTIIDSLLIFRKI